MKFGKLMSNWSAYIPTQFSQNRSPFVVDNADYIGVRVFFGHGVYICVCVCARACVCVCLLGTSICVSVPMSVC